MEFLKKIIMKLNNLIFFFLPGHFSFTDSNNIIYLDNFFFLLEYLVLFVKTFFTSDFKL